MGPRGKRPTRALLYASRGPPHRGVQKALNFATTEYNKASNDKFAFKVSRVLKVQKQVVNGLKYIITVNMARTTCTNSYVVVENCELHKEPELLKTVKCNFEIYTVPWKSMTKLLKRQCEE
ncbi:cystatin-like [Pleurodeles waltl]|uniref:cystatin-like n=1 Tax=Pleurodeles waltl TaxID=8319 RepID=UPI0037094870